MIEDVYADILLEIATLNPDLLYIMKKDKDFNDYVRARLDDPQYIEFLKNNPPLSQQQIKQIHNTPTYFISYAYSTSDELSASHFENSAYIDFWFEKYSKHQKSSTFKKLLFIADQLVLNLNSQSMLQLQRLDPKKAYANKLQLHNNAMMDMANLLLPFKKSSEFVKAAIITPIINNATNSLRNVKRSFNFSNAVSFVLAHIALIITIPLAIAENLISIVLRSIVAIGTSSIVVQRLTKSISTALVSLLTSIVLQSIYIAAVPLLFIPITLGTMCWQYVKSYHNGVHYSKEQRDAYAKKIKELPQRLQMQKEGPSLHKLLTAKEMLSFKNTCNHAMESLQKSLDKNSLTVAYMAIHQFEGQLCTLTNFEDIQKATVIKLIKDSITGLGPLKMETNSIRKHLALTDEQQAFIKTLITIFAALSKTQQATEKPLSTAEEFPQRALTIIFSNNLATTEPAIKPEDLRRKAQPNALKGEDLVWTADAKTPSKHYGISKKFSIHS